MVWLKQSTAATVKIGPFLDSTDGVTAETALSIAQADIRLSKNGGSFAQTNNATGATHDENGYYGVPLDTTDTGTLGRLRIAVTKTGALPVWHDVEIVPANVWDSFFSTDLLQVDTREVAGTTQTARDIGASVLLSSGTGTGQVSLSSGLVTLAPVTHTGAVIPTVTTLTGHTAQTGDCYARLGAPAGASVSADVAAVKAETASIQSDTNDIQTRIPAALVSGRIDASVGAMAAGVVTAAAVATGAIDADAIATDAVTEIQSGLATSSALSTVAGYIDTEVAAIKAKTDNLPAAPAATGDIPSAAANAAALLDATDAIETGLTPRNAIRLIAAATAGDVSDAGTSTVTIKSAVSGSKSRISAAVDADGNRTVTPDLT